MGQMTREIRFGQKEFAGIMFPGITSFRNHQHGGVFRCGVRRFQVFQRALGFPFPASP